MQTENVLWKVYEGKFKKKKKKKKKQRKRNNETK